MRWFTALAAVFKGGSLAKPVEISHWLTVGGQPTADDLKALKKQGFRSVVNLRRAGENNQPLTPEKERAEAEAAGLAYYHLPVSPKELRNEHVEAFRQSLEGLPGPVFVHCGGGQRAGAFALLHEADPNASGEDVLRQAKMKGVSLPDPEVVDFIKQYMDAKGKPKP
ncbi:sulfur transferase domain-containing protein [Bosea sp. (in: a-proteobacteria)]|uniref:beta-lactamase hydrolase domain-containing protein n=1 Tax=Bosea sp. (in: a-proteobacteria) TaxID=1871050 RepID=UPI00122429DE|nr:sulfur transferase domain-containing protein [Bosea sp. (in: a-proteobacteria)]TAJ30072.1 MAG: phosphatase [Bosea sp. (in: a-proteobacteria)]